MADNPYMAVVEQARQQTANPYMEVVRQARERAAAMPQEEPRGDIRDPFLQGVSFGLYDEGAGVVSGALAKLRGEDFSPAYNERVQELRDDYAAYRERRPRVSMGAEIAGGLLPAMIPGGAAMRGATLAGKMGRAAGMGAATGALYGFNQGEGNLSVDRFTRGMTGGATGGLIGGALPMAGAAAGRAGRYVMDKVRPNAATKAGINRGAQGEINRTLAADDMSLDDLAARLKEFGPDATPMDASEGLREAGRQMVQFGNPGHAPLAALGRDRGRQAASRIGGAFEEVLGKRPAPARLVEALQKRTQRNAGRNFGIARNAVADPDNIPYNPALQPALDAERKTMQRARVPEGDMPDGSYEFMTNAQRRISGKKRAAERSVDAGGGASAFDDATVLRADEGELVLALDNATGGKYSVARSKYADDKQLQEAFDYGFKKAMSSGTEISFLQKEWSGMSTPEKVAARAGVRAWLGQKAGSVRGGRSVARDVLNEGDARAKMATIFGDDVTNRLGKAMEGQEAMWVTDDALKRAGGAQTARNTAGRLNPDNQSIPRDITMFGTATRGAQSLLNALNKPNSMTRSLGPALASQGDDAQRLVQALIDSQQGYNGSRAIQSLLRNAGGAATMAPATTMQPEDILQLIVRPKRR